MTVEGSAGQVILESIGAMKNPVHREAAMKILGRMTDRHAERKLDTEREQDTDKSHSKDSVLDNVRNDRDPSSRELREQGRSRSQELGR